MAYSLQLIAYGLELFYEVFFMEEDQLQQTYLAYHRAVYAPGALDKKTKELIALAVATAIKCTYCINSHSQKAKVNGATPQEMKEAIYVAATTCAGATLSYGKKCWTEQPAQPGQ